MRHTQSQNLLSEQGQTLVETVVGIFVLTIGISTALGLAVSMFNATTSAVKQVVAAGLAREGMEAVFNMRATNWLKGQLATDCYNYTSTPAGDLDAYCHKDWQKVTPDPGGTYDLDPPGGGLSYALGIDTGASSSQPYWVLTAQPPGNQQFRLYYDASAASGVFYKTTSGGSPASDYYREIILTEETPAPYNVAQNTIGPRLKVTSRVWWDDRRCPSSTTWPTSGGCRIELVSYLTNWRNY